MFKFRTLIHGLLVFALVSVSCVTFLSLENTALADNGNPYIIGKFQDNNGKQIDVLSFPKKPKDKDTEPVALAGPEIEIQSESLVIVDEVPAFDWSYGCSATSAAMLFGYYDRNAYPDIYTGTVDNGLCPLTNEVWGYTVYDSVTCGECPLSATHLGLEGRTTRGHVDDYWVDYNDSGNDPYDVYGWDEHTPQDCLGDFMGTNQDVWDNSDGSTIFVFYTNGDPIYDDGLVYAEQLKDWRDGCHGMKLFAESRGYTVLNNYNQYIQGYGTDPTKGFTFEDYMDEIDAGRPVLIHVVGHTMIGYGYDAAINRVYLHDTWDWSDHYMTWGGYYAGMRHTGVSVIELEPVADTIPPYTTGHNPADGASNVPVNTDIVVHVLDDYSGVNIDSIKMAVGGSTVVPVITGSADDYTLTYNPPSDFGYSQVVYITVDASDLEGNIMATDEYSFTAVPEYDTVPPYTAGYNPADSDSNVPVNTDIIVHVLDDYSGVDIDSIEMTVEGAAVFPVITGSADDYTLTYDTPVDFEYSQVVNVSVSASDMADNMMETYTYSFTIEEPQVDFFYASQDINVQNSGITGSYISTQDTDNYYEGIRERESGGKPSGRYSYLEHKWAIPVTGGLKSYVFYLEAYHTGNSEGDDFQFAYSTDGFNYVDMMTIIKTTDDDSYQEFNLPASISGTIYIKVTDTDRTGGNRNLDTVYIDHMYVMGTSVQLPNNPPQAPSVPIPEDGATGTGITPTLSVYVYDPDGNNMNVSFFDEYGNLLGTDNNVSSGSRASISLVGLSYETTYGWYVVADDGEYQSESEIWHFNTGPYVEPGGMYVSDISWSLAGINIKSIITVRWDSDGDGIAEDTDELVSGATVYYTMTNTDTGEQQVFVVTTDDTGQVSVQWKKASRGYYQGLVTDIDNNIYIYNSEMDIGNPSYFNF